MTDIAPLLPPNLRASFEEATPLPSPAADLPALTAASARPGADVATNDIVPHIRSARLSAAVRAGLLLINGEDELSHHVSQANEGEPDCDYWHAIIHRREPDYGNSGYWFRRIGHHPAMETLPAEAAKAAEEFGVTPEAADLLGSQWDPATMIDACRRAAGSPASDFHLFCRAVQWAEMRSLLRHCLSGSQTVG